MHLSFLSFFFFSTLASKKESKTKNHLEDKIRTVTQPLYKLHTNYRFLCLIWYTSMYNFFLSCASRYNCEVKSRAKNRSLNEITLRSSLEKFHYPQIFSSCSYAKFLSKYICIHPHFFAPSLSKRENIFFVYLKIRHLPRLSPRFLFHSTIDNRAVTGTKNLPTDVVTLHV